MVDRYEAGNVHDAEQPVDKGSEKGWNELGRNKMNIANGLSDSARPSVCSVTCRRNRTPIAAKVFLAGSRRMVLSLDCNHCFA